MTSFSFSHPIEPPTALANHIAPVSSVIVKLMFSVPSLSQWANVPITDITSVQQWRECGNASLKKLGYAKKEISVAQDPDSKGPQEHSPPEPAEIYNTLGIWLGMLASTHQEDEEQIYYLGQQWLNVFGRWPITMAFFITSTPEGTDIPDGMKGANAEAAMWFKAYLTDLSRHASTLPMIPVLWQDSITLRTTLARMLEARNTAASKQLLENAQRALDAHTPKGEHVDLPSTNGDEKNQPKEGLASTFEAMHALSLQERSQAPNKSETTVGDSKGSEPVDQPSADDERDQKTPQ